jgi:endonuclease-3
MDRKIKLRTTIKALKKAYPDVRCELNYTTPLELAVATILSAQCTDVKVNQVTPALFKRCRKPEDYVRIDLEDLEVLVRQTGFYRQKAKNIKKMAQMLVELHGSEVPRTIEELIKLPGIGRKTANVILGNAFGIPGFPVDTHVIRLSGRIGLTEETDPVKIEHDMCAIMPKSDWTVTSLLLIFHGRRVCIARKPNCPQCSITELCSYYQSHDGLARGILGPKKIQTRAAKSSIARQSDNRLIATKTARTGEKTKNVTATKGKRWSS